MIRYNEKTNRFEFVSAEEIRKEFLDNILERGSKKTIAPDEPIRIEFEMEDTFEFKQSDFDENKSKNKNKKEALVESAMGSVDEILSRHFRTIRGAIEQQIRRAYRQGYCDGIDDAPDAPGEYDSYREGFIDGVAYCKKKTWQIRPEEGLVRQKMEDSI